MNIRGNMKFTKETFKKSVIAGLGGAIAIFVILIAGFLIKQPILIAPFGASCLLLFGIPESPLARPRNLIGGHFISSLIGLIMLSLFGNSYIVISIAVGLAIFAMIFTDTTHPPAAADPIVIITASASWSFLFINTISGALLLFIVAFIYHNARGHQYPSRENLIPPENRTICELNDI